MHSYPALSLNDLQIGRERKGQILKVHRRTEEEEEEEDSMGIGKSKAASMYKIIFVLGGPGSGKGTQCSKLVRNLGLFIYDKNGQIVPSHVTVSLLEKAMKDSGKDTFLIDGFPRNEENRASFEKQTGISPRCVLFFDCSEQVMQDRLLGRNEGRTDDNIETIKKRFGVFKEQSMPVVEYYRKMGKVAQIDAERSQEDVYTDVKASYLKFMQ
eukprot:jgi/Picre1/29690/NNA_005073.t1